jgi:flagellar biosynthetic protein FlhB
VPWCSTRQGGDGLSSKDGRTEKATPKRRREARKQGQVARAPELAQAATLIVTVVMLPVAVGRLAHTVQADWQIAITRIARPDPKLATAMLSRFFLHATIAVAPLFVSIMVAGVVANLVMVGPKPNGWQLKPKLQRVSPKAGIKRLFGKQQIWELIKNTGKLALLALVAYGTWRTAMNRLIGTSGSLESLLSALAQSISALLRRVAMLALLIGVVDAILAFRRHNKSMRMTKHDVREESRQSEGNPQAKGAIRARQRKLSRLRMIAAVAKADVVLTNPTHLAIALAYEDGSAAPVVVAKGAGVIAERIRAEARKHGVPVMENKPLARALYKVADVGDSIPVNLFRAVAEVLALVYRTRPTRLSKVA